MYWKSPLGRAMSELLGLAWPIAAAMGGETLMGLVDAKLVGGLGAAALGGVGVAMTFVFLGYMFVFGLMRGIKVCVAHAIGEGRGYLSVRYAQAGVAIGILAGVFFWACTRNAAPLLHAVGIAPALVPYAATFLAAFTVGAPASAVHSALVHHRHAIGDTRTPMTVGLAANVLNAALGYCLIYGRAGLPALGVRGAAFATATAEGFAALALIALLVKHARQSGDHARARAALSLRAAAHELAAVGVPTGVQFGSEMLAMVVFTAVLGSLGAEQIAAHQIALATIRTSILPGIAIAEAASVLVGRALGRQALAEADRAVRAALVVTASFMTACGAAFAIGSHAIARAFTADARVAGVAIVLLWIASCFQVFDAIAIVLRGALRGAKDVHVPAVIGITVIWTCVPTAALVLGKTVGWGSVGAWLGFLGETMLGAGLYAWRWRRGRWRLGYGASSVGAPPPSMPWAEKGLSRG
jgi:MATE family multidrug resistance protein